MDETSWHIYDLVNPSDAYTFRAADDLTAALAALVLGEGKIGCNRLVKGRREVDTGLFMPFGATCAGVLRALVEEYGRASMEAFGLSVDAWLAFEGEDKERADGDLGLLLKARRVHTDAALLTVLIGGANDRLEVEAALGCMRPSEAERWLAERHDRRRSSISNYGDWAVSQGRRSCEMTQVAALLEAAVLGGELTVSDTAREAHPSWGWLAKHATPEPLVMVAKKEAGAGQ